jgi:hypothetical protein
MVEVLQPTRLKKRERARTLKNGKQKLRTERPSPSKYARTGEVRPETYFFICSLDQGCRL